MEMIDNIVMSFFFTKLVLTNKIYNFFLLEVKNNVALPEL